MPTFVLLTRLEPGGLTSGRSVRHLERQTVDHIRRECPGVEWERSLALLGPYDYLDIFTAPDLETATRVSTLIHIHGHATTETWGAIEWDRFKELLEAMPPELIREPVG
ncbi:MAG TPA: GYD domain-containing protein [Gemmatimonadales bacterium]|nr:GYD domain-containing protein [Gemmatimonadales bacterium]